MNRRILLIDDNEAIHRDFEKVLGARPSPSAELEELECQLLGETPAEARPEYDLVFASQGQEGLEKLEEAVECGRPFSVAFVDMRMPPGWDGVETIEHLWARDPYIQVVICTAYSDYSWEETVGRLGQNDRLLILKKPFEAIEIRQAACALTEKWLLNEQIRRQNAELKRANEDLLESNARLQEEIDARRRAEERLRHDAFHDTLTDLPNRSLLIERMTRSIARFKRDPACLYATLFIDLDNFKVINDSLGHRAGDELIKEVSRRVAPCFRALDTAARPQDDTTARLGGDEFIVLLDGIKKPEDAALVAERVLRVFDLPFTIGNSEVRVTASIGVTVADPLYEDADEIIRDADTALHQAKAAGKAKYAVFKSEMRDRVVSRMQLEHDLHRAIERRQLFLLYQPIVSLTTGEIEGFEALLRWMHPERGLVAPDEFVPIAEENGLIVPIGEWVLREACVQCEAWRRDRPDHPTSISVNLSSRQLAGEQLLETVEVALASAGLDPALLNLEITETMIVEDRLSVGRTLERLRRLKIGVYLDDFGTGYSSLSYLHDLPIDVIKLDREFVRDMSHDGRHAATIHALMVLARSRGFRVVAEGVETPEQLRLLRSLECDLAQGYYFSKPVEPEAAQALHSISGKWQFGEAQSA